MSSLLETLEKMIAAFQNGIGAAETAKILTDARRYLAVLKGDRLPQDEDEHEAIGGRRGLDPNDVDMYHASHRSLKPCPFCREARYPITSSEINPRSNIILCRVSCVDCIAQVFYSERQAAKYPEIDDEVRQRVRRRAIERWETRRPTQWEREVSEILSELLDAGDRRDVDVTSRALVALEAYVRRGSTFEKAKCALCSEEIGTIPIGALQGGSIVCEACLGKYAPSSDIIITPVDFDAADKEIMWKVRAR